MKKGFTLIELLAVIVILGVIMAIIIPNVQRSIDDSKTKLYDLTVKEIIKATKNYVIKYGSDIDGLESTGVGYVTIGELVNSKVIDAPVTNPETGDEFDYNAAVKVTKDTDGNYSFDFLIDGAP